MKSLRCVLALLGLALFLPEARAQGIFIASGPGFGGGFSYSHHHHHYGLTLGGYGLGVPVPTYGVSRVTVIYGYTPPPTVVIVPRRLRDDDDLPPERPVRPRVPQEPAPNMDEAPLPGQPAGRFRPVEPEDRLRAKRPVEAVPMPPEKKPPQEPPPPPKPQEKPPPDPRTQQWTHLEQGKAAFAAQAYGLAAQHFRQATISAPDRPEPYFLLAQALVALGKYREAVEAIHTGLSLEPGWPAMQYRPMELYGPNVADYSEHLRALGEIVSRRPDDGDLLFLFGYQLWFDGRKDEARDYFRRAARHPSRKADSEGFLQNMPGMPIF